MVVDVDTIDSFLPIVVVVVFVVVVVEVVIGVVFVAVKSSFATVVVCC
jgi:hypothetical protein